MPPRARVVKPPRGDTADAAFRRFLSLQKEGLEAWARRRAALTDEVGMSAEMEALVCDLLEELRRPVMRRRGGFCQQIIEWRAHSRGFSQVVNFTLQCHA